MSAALAGVRVLLTGATGFLGSHLARALVLAGADVHGLGRRVAAGVDGAGLTWHRADLLDPGSVAAAVAAARPSIVFHLAAYGTTPAERDEAMAVRVNVEGSLALWQALGATTLRVVAAGSSGEYGAAAMPAREDAPCAPVDVYGASKLAAGNLLLALGRRDGREVVVLRLFGVYGPGDRPERVLPHVIASLLAGRPAPLTHGEQRRDFTYVSDAVDALLLAATRPLEPAVQVLNVGGGGCHRLRDVLEAAARLVGADREALLQFGALPSRPGDPQRLCASLDAVGKSLGYAARVSLADGLARTVDAARGARP